MKIALVHDSFTQMGGAERVVDALHELFPDAPVFTLVFDIKFKEKYKDWDIRTSGLQTLYSALGKLQYLLPLIPWGVDNLDFTGYDLVISSSSSWAKNIYVPKNCRHICYCHTPTRFLWTEPDYVKQEVPMILRPFARLFISKMKKWDYNGAQRVTKFIANSKEVQSRIKKYYNRDSEIIYPFIDTSFWHPVFPIPLLAKEGAGEVMSDGETSLSSRRHSEPRVHPRGEESLYRDDEILRSAALPQNDAVSRSYFLLAGRLQAHKQNDVIVEIFNELGLPLHVVGTGRQENYLKLIAKPNISFLGHVNDERLREEYSGAKVLIYPQLEDFGLMPLEAAACGTPTLALGRGGALETVVPGITGELFGQSVVSPLMRCPENQTAYESAIYKSQIKSLILSCSPQKYSLENLRAQAEKFSKAKFKQRILNFVNLK